MKTATLILTLVVTSLTAAPREIGSRVVAPSQRGYTVESVRESGERGGMLLPVGTNFTGIFNREMGDAIEKWNAHNWDEAVIAFRNIWQSQPSSPWAAEAELHEACYLKYNSRYDEAEDRFLSVLNKHPNSVEIRNKVLRYLPHLYAQTGRYQTALELMDEMKKLPLGWQERQYVENYVRIFARARGKDEADRLCGTRALALALAAQNEHGETLRNVSLETAFKRHAWASQKAAHTAGFSLQDLAGFASGQPVELDENALRAAARPGNPVLVHLKAPAEPKCSSIFPRAQRQNDLPLTGHFVVVETITDSYVDLLDPDLGRTRWPLGHFQYRWSGRALRLPGQNAFGKALPAEQAQALRGGCCGSPPPDPSDECGDDSGGGGGSSGSGGGGRAGRGSAGVTAGSVGGGGDVPQSRGGAGCRSCGGGDCCEEKEGHGAPIYRFGMSSANLVLKDIPMWSTDAKGTPMNLQLIYNRVATQRMATNNGANYYAFGNKWHCNFFSHFTETPDGSGDIVLPGGRVERFLQGANGSYAALDIWNRNTLVETNGFFILTFKETGNQWYFNTNTALGQRLEKVEDPYGNTMTYSYDPAFGRLSSVADAAGRSFQFYYDGDGYVTNVIDSLGRNAAFAYQNGDLASLTDMGGLTTTIQYDTNHWPTNITYPSGESWQIVLQTYAQLPPPYNNYPDCPFRMVVTDPLGQTNEYFYHAFDYMGPITLRDPSGNNWLHAARAVGESEGGGAQRIYYSGVNATAEPYTGVSDQWENRTFDADANPIEVATVNQNVPVSIGYDNNEGSRVIGVLTTNLFDGRHNLLSSTLLTNASADLYNPDLRVVGTWTNLYDSRDNLVWAKNPLNQITMYGYNARDNLTAITNALDQVTRMAYDHNGSLTNMVDALLRTNHWFFNDAGLEKEALYPDGLRTTKGYDSIGRLAAVTNHGSGLYLQYYHDNLDRLRDVVFPDGTSNHSEYSCCGLDWTRDRLNRVTTFGRDALGRTTSVTDPQDRLTEFRYNGADQITNLITHVSGQQRVKRFDYLSTNGFSRLAQVTTPMGKLTAYDYNFKGGLAWRKDGNGKVTKYQYDPLDRLVSVADYYDNELVRMDYDVLGNVTYVSNLHSVFQYTYDPLNRATQAVCQIKDIPGCAAVQYKIAYTFDPVGNVTNRLITGQQGFTTTIRTAYGYDTMNRLTNVVQWTNSAVTASAWYQYDSAGRLWKKGYGNGDVVTHGYDSESRLLSLGITNGATMVARFEYKWDIAGNILAITNNGTNINLYGYDLAGQLTNEVCFTNGIAGFVTNSWEYDEAGNWRNASGSSKWLYNQDNELVARAPTSTAETPSGVTVTGSVDAGPNNIKWFNTWASCRGVQARVSTSDGGFSLPGVPLDWGDNALNVTVRDVSGNSSQQTRNVYKAITGANETFRYDGNGNLTNWISGTTNWVYEWDWADRMTKVTSNGVVVLENYYDAGSHRIAKAEVVGSSITRFVYLYDGWDIVGVSLAGSGLYETYTRGVSLAGDIGGLIAVSQHSPSARYYVHSNHRGDVMQVRDGTATVATYCYSAFGQLLATTGTDFSRFKFSSKERDPSAGLLYYGYRFYAPMWQRWMSTDPERERSGVNLYCYVRNRPIAGIDERGLKDRSGQWDEGGLENDCSSPVWVIDLDNKRVYLVAPGTEAPEGVDWDFVLLPNGKWHKIGVGELDICDSGPKRCQWGFGVFGRAGGHRPATRGETDAIDQIWEDVPQIYIGSRTR